jgi:hypothetical protein
LISNYHVDVNISIETVDNFEIIITIDINHRSNEYFQKSINTKSRYVQGKSCSDHTDKETNRETEKQTLRIIIP